MDTIFMNSENSKTSKSHVLKLKLRSKLDLRSGGKVCINKIENRITFKIKDGYSLELLTL